MKIIIVSLLFYKWLKDYIVNNGNIPPTYLQLLHDLVFVFFLLFSIVYDLGIKAY